MPRPYIPNERDKLAEILRRKRAQPGLNIDEVGVTLRGEHGSAVQNTEVWFTQFMRQNGGMRGQGSHEEEEEEEFSTLESDSIIKHAPPAPGRTPFECGLVFLEVEL